ncbi:MAG: bifunctional glutamate N-acetyltransferase/amino-acid acetyltransferase ArgJ [Candidatus Sulfobium sp.]|jgi:glutamate N-acetyltransferase/amino-acid N-acetyltransferase
MMKKSRPLPRGFSFSATEAAIKKPGRKDFALIVSEEPAVMAGCFTTNSVKAAPVRLCMKKIRSGRGKAVIVNSGNANACTGKQGLKDAGAIISAVSKNLGIPQSMVYICSTGVIGTRLPMERINNAVPALVRDRGKLSIDDVAEAIMTTDTFPKVLHKRIRIAGKAGSISGICKGSGMVAPDMATLLCFLITDIAVERKTLDRLLREAVKKSFNRVTIDGDMSTNDTVLMMANGMAGNVPITGKSEYLEPFRKALHEITYGLAWLLVRDGEGATKVIKVSVKGARSVTEAEKAAFAVANSNLVKTAIYGNDANWGRIMAALGYSGIRFSEKKTDISFNNVKVVKAGLSNGRDDEATEVLRSKEVRITIDMHSGKSSAEVLTCDFTEEYVKINAEYRT